nr:RNA-directed DNA polymerase, eukaryota, reverse transcriptase zinc-binding domain protein [Tanacetum cinerariifolium]
RSNESLNKLWTLIKVPSPSFVVDERVIWIEVSGLPLFKESAFKDSKEGDQANVSTYVAGDNETLFFGKVREEYFFTNEDKPSEEDVSDTSKPLGFKNFIKKYSECSISSNASRSGKCSTFFGNYKRKELKGFSFIDEMSRMIEVGGTLGYDVKGSKKSL